MHNCPCHLNCCSTIMINVKFAVTMLLCTHTGGCVVTVCFVLKLFGDWFIFYLHSGGVHLRVLSLCTYVSRVEMFKRSSLLYSSSGTFTASTVNTVGGPSYFQSQAVRRGSPYVVYLSLFLAVWSCRVVWLVCVGRRTSCDSCAFRNSNNFHIVHMFVQ